jgi:hypothetical protein
MWLFPEVQILSVEQKAKIVWDHGTYLMCRCKDRYAITLHALEGHFIEIWLDAVERRVCILHSFRGTARLEPYLDKLPLPEGHSCKDSRAVE